MRQPQRWMVLAAAALAMGLWTLPAGADTQSELASARDRLAEIQRDIGEQQRILTDLEREADALAARVEQAESRVEEIQGELELTQDSLDRAQARLEAVRDQLNERVRQLYMQGPASNLDFILGASSMGDLADRMEYSAAIGQADVDLANRVENLNNQLSTQLATQQDLLDRQTSALADLNEQQGELDAKLQAQADAYDAIVAKRGEAERIVGNLKDKYQHELQAAVPPAVPATGGGGGTVSGIFQACPVGQPRAISDGFGAPRYGGGYHLHAGNDIMAPTGTPIYATFAGTATDGSNTLGGLSVVVSGSSGYTYNAHMSEIGQLGAVQAGDIIGYVGATGDTSTPHNHFEWHPNVIPADWPESPYGYSVIGDAVNPYPILAAVC